MSTHREVTQRSSREGWKHLHDGVGAEAEAVSRRRLVGRDVEDLQLVGRRGRGDGHEGALVLWVVAVREDRRLRRAERRARAYA